MDDDTIRKTGRRKLLAILGSVGVGGSVVSSLVSDEGSAPTTDSPPLPQETAVKPTVPEQIREQRIDEQSDERTADQSEPVSVLDFGAVLDGVTDDTTATQNALNAAAPDGTVLIPPGELRIGAHGSDTKTALAVDQRHSNVTIQGAGPGNSVIRMAPDHEGVHWGIRVLPDKGSSVDDLTIMDLTLDGRGSDQNYRVGIGIDVESTTKTQAVTVRNAVVQNWAVNGLTIESPGTRIIDCTLRNNGKKSHKAGGFDGHGVVSRFDLGVTGKTVVDGCLFENNTGAGLDNGSGRAVLRNSVIKNCGYGVKLNEATTRQVLENVHIADCHSEPGIYNISSNEDAGELVLRNVRIEGSPDPGIYLPAGNTISGDNIAIVDTNKTGELRAGVMSTEEGRRFDVGKMSVHGTDGGYAVDLRGSKGSIGILIQGDNDKGIGKLGSVSTGTIKHGEPLAFSLPKQEDVGAK